MSSRGRESAAASEAGDAPVRREEKAGLTPGETTGLGPRGLTRRGDPTFGRLPLKTIIYMGTARKP